MVSRWFKTFQSKMKRPYKIINVTIACGIEPENFQFINNSAQKSMSSYRQLNTIKDVKASKILLWFLVKRNQKSHSNPLNLL